MTARLVLKCEERLSNYACVSEKFSSELRRSLDPFFGKTLTAESLAREFNLRASGCDSITRETGRRWLTGSALPEYGRLVVLKKWLELDMNFIFDPSICFLHPTKSQSRPSDKEIDVINALDKIVAQARILRDKLAANDSDLTSRTPKEMKKNPTD